jgi:hypothetical protein
LYLWKKQLGKAAGLRVVGIAGSVIHHPVISFEIPHSCFVVLMQSFFLHFLVQSVLSYFSLALLLSFNFPFYASLFSARRLCLLCLLFLFSFISFLHSAISLLCPFPFLAFYFYYAFFAD